MAGSHRRLQNRSEEATYEILRNVTSAQGVLLYSKVRVADVVNIDDAPRQHRDYGLRAHFDFVVADAEHNPVFAVEFDGPSHGDADAKRRDDAKHYICAATKFPYVRVRAQHVFKTIRAFTVVEWLAEVWFTDQAIWQAVIDGVVPEDALLDPMGVIRSNEGKPVFPFWIGNDARLRLHQLRGLGRLGRGRAWGTTGVRDDGWWRSIAAQEVADNRFVIADQSIRAFAFPSIYDLLDELCAEELALSVESYLSGDSVFVNRHDTDRFFASFVADYKSCAMWSLG